jgi:hypothetical protein
MEYPHWLMVAGAVLVVVAFVGLGFSLNRNLEQTEDNVHPAPAPNSPVAGEELSTGHWMMISCEIWQRSAAALPRLDGYSIAVLRPSESAPRFSK